MMDARHFGTIEQWLIELLEQLDSFSKAERLEVQEFIDVGEYGIATETAYHIVRDERKTINEQASNLFQALAEKMGIQETIAVDLLVKQIK